MYYEVYSGLIFDNLVQAESETGVPLGIIKYSYRTGDVVKFCSQKYKFINLKEKIHYAE